jgi:hypothetical protein
MKPEKFFFPLMVFAAVVTVYLLLRKPHAQATTIIQPSTSQSGVPNTATESPTSYNVQTPQLAASPLVYLQDPYTSNPAESSPKHPPSYLAFNFGPSHDLTKKPNPDLHKLQKVAQGKGCGCGGGCNSCSRNNNTFPDGSGQTKLASTGRRQVENAPEDWLILAQDNLTGSL